MPRPREWTEKEIDFLRCNYGTIGAVGCSERLGRPIQGIRVKAWKMGFKGMEPGIKWTPQMEKMVKDFFPIMFSADLAKWIGVSKRSLIRKARELGIEKMDGFLDKKREDINRRSGCKHGNSGSFRKGSGVGKEYRFKKGHQMTPESKEKQSEALKRYWARRKKMESLGLEWRKNKINAQ